MKIGRIGRAGVAQAGVALVQENSKEFRRLFCQRSKTAILLFLSPRSRREGKKTCSLSETNAGTETEGEGSRVEKASKQAERGGGHA